MLSNDFIPLHIRAYLRTPVVSDNWLPLDGILLYQAFRDRFGFRDAALPGESGYDDEKRDVHAPLKLVRGKYPYYCCSWAVWGPHCDGMDYWNKRFEFPVDWQWMEEVNRIDVSSSSYKKLPRADLLPIRALGGLVCGRKSRKNPLFLVHLYPHR